MNDYIIYGNRGNVWNNSAHAMRSGRNLCGTPALARNHAKMEGVKAAGCPECLEILEEESQEENGFNFDRLKEAGFYGVDACLKVSLEEYIFILRPDKKETNCWQVMHKLQDDVYDISYLREGDLLDSWIQEDESFFSFTGLSLEEWNDGAIHHRLADVIGYFGQENALGTSYHTFTPEQLALWINKYMK